MTTTTKPTIETAIAFITPSVEAMTMNGADGLRATASKLGIKAKGVAKVDLVVAVATAKANLLLPGMVADWEASQPKAPKLNMWGQVAGVDLAAEPAVAPVSEVHRTRNHNATIRPSGGRVAMVDVLWNALNETGGISTTELCSMVCELTPGLKAGSVVSRLATQRANGAMLSTQVTDDNGRVQAFWTVAPGTDKAVWMRKFLKITE